MMRGDAGRQLSPGFRHDLRHWEHREVGTPTAGTQHNGLHNRWHFDSEHFLVGPLSPRRVARVLQPGARPCVLLRTLLPRGLQAHSLYRVARPEICPGLD